MRLVLAAITLAAFSLSAYCDTVIESKDPEGGVSKISIDGEWARFDEVNGGGKGYLLVNTKARKAYMVVPAEQVIIEFPVDKADKQAVPRDVNIGFESLGEGPKVAGYATELFELMANEQLCGTALLSRQVTEIKDVNGLLAATGGLNPRLFMPEEMWQGLRGEMEPCDAARMQFPRDGVLKQGFPLKVTNSKGDTVSEVVSIKQNAELKPGMFELPKGYNRTTVKQMMDGMRQEMKGSMGKINEMMKDLSPEERAKMEQMMKQFGRSND